MITFHSEETIERSPEEIYEVAADVARHPQWMGVVEAELLRGRSTEVGARARETMETSAGRVDVEFEVSVAEPGKRIGWRTVPGQPVDADVTLEIEATGPSSARVAWMGSMQFAGMDEAGNEAMAPEVEEGEAMELRRLKALLESGS